jgi:ATP-dependent DNA helicase PIF1
MKLTEKQQLAIKLLSSGKNVFITGPGGVGKTELIKYYINKSQNKRGIALTSTTGTSAVLIGGSTMHSYLGIGYGRGSVEQMVMSIEAKPWVKKKWIGIKCLIIDEVSMLDPILFGKLDQIGRYLRDGSKPFGGIQIVLSGDFLQLPCVGSDKFCFESEEWNEYIKDIVYMNEIIRQTDTTWKNTLNDIRIGNITETIKEILASRVGVKLENEYGVLPTRLYSTNRDVDSINEMELDKLAEDRREFREYEMSIQFASHVKSPSRHVITEKFLKNVSVPQTLQLCLDAQVILLKNLDVENGLANGSRGVIVGFTQEDDLPIVRFLNGQEIPIGLEDWKQEEDGKLTLLARQIPLKVAYAITIHRCQGITLDYAEIDLSSVFEFGQAYVALSRVKSLEGLSIIAIDFNRIVAHPNAVEYYNSLE